MDKEKLLSQWLAEQQIAYIKGWDFGHIENRYEEHPLPWSYAAVIKQHLADDMKLLDMDTGGGEFLLSLGHPYSNTSATEGFAPNVKLCSETLLPLGIDFKCCDDVANLPFEDESFDIVVNRHGSFEPAEINRVLKKGGLFVTQQVGDDNDLQLVELLMPGTPKSFENLNLEYQCKEFEKAGFEILQGEECFVPIRFFDIGALVWFARIIQWEFPGFSVEKCADKLFAAQKLLEQNGSVDGTVHRYLIVAQKR